MRLSLNFSSFEKVEAEFKDGCGQSMGVKFMGMGSMGVIYNDDIHDIYKRNIGFVIIMCQ